MGKDCLSEISLVNRSRVCSSRILSVALITAKAGYT